MQANSSEDDPALARKRRIQLRASARTEEEGDQPSKRSRIEAIDDWSESEGERRKPSLRGIKKQARYEPGVPMTREELAVWRKEARRVRNRESAAASRQKTRERIEQLEAQVSELQDRYEKALQRIAELEGKGPLPSPSIPYISIPKRVSPQSSPKVSPVASPKAPQNTISLEDLSEVDLHHAASQMWLPSHDIVHPSMISRPTAVCSRYV